MYVCIKLVCALFFDNAGAHKKLFLTIFLMLYTRTYYFFFVMKFIHFFCTHYYTYFPYFELQHCVYLEFLSKATKKNMTGLHIMIFFTFR